MCKASIFILLLAVVQVTAHASNGYVAKPALNNNGGSESTEGKRFVENPSVTAVAFRAAQLKIEQGLYSEAEEILRGIVEERGAPNNKLRRRDLIISLNYLAGLYSADRNTLRGEPISRRALVMSEQFGDLELLVLCLNQFAYFEILDHKYASARSLLTRAAEAARTQLGANHPGLGFVLTNLGYAEMQDGLFNDARVHIENAVQYQKSIFGPRSIPLANALLRLAQLDHRVGNLASAEVEFKGSLQMAETIAGSEHPSLEPFLNSYAGLLEQQKRYSEAKQIAARAALIGNKQSVREMRN